MRENEEASSYRPATDRGAGWNLILLLYLSSMGIATKGHPWFPKIHLNEGQMLGKNS